MSEQTYADVLLENTGYAVGANHLLNDVRKGSQFGWSPRFSQWMSSSADVPPNLVCVLLRSPGFFQVMDDPSAWHMALKELFEVHARKWEGFNATLTAEFSDHQFGGGGEIQHELVDMKREPSVPKINLVDKRGAPFQMLHEYWMRYGGMDPATKVPLTSTLAKARTPEMKREASIAGWYTASALFFEPDRNFQDVVRAWTCVNMFPKSSGTVERNMDKTSARTQSELDIEYTAISDYSDGSIRLAQSLLERINILGADPKKRDNWITDPAPELWGDGGYGVDDPPLAGRI